MAPQRLGIDGAQPHQCSGWRISPAAGDGRCGCVKSTGSHCVFPQRLGIVGVQPSRRCAQKRISPASGDGRGLLRSSRKSRQYFPSVWGLSAHGFAFTSNQSDFPSVWGFPSVAGYRIPAPRGVFYCLKKFGTPKNPTFQLHHSELVKALTGQIPKLCHGQEDDKRCNSLKQTKPSWSSVPA